MYKILTALIVLLATGCVNNKLEKRVETLESQMTNVHYEFVHQMCHIGYSKCMVDKKGDCWNKHEACVIRAYKMWRPLLD